MKQRTKSVLAGSYFALWGLYVGWALIFGEVHSIILGIFALVFLVGGLVALWSVKQDRYNENHDDAPDERPASSFPN